MRLWSIHPKYLDAIGLIALWREALLAKKVLEGKTKSYKNHPQLERFKNSPRPERAIRQYLANIFTESCGRGYCFEKGKIGTIPRKKVSIPVKRGQLKYEIDHLRKKVRKRSPLFFKKIRKLKIILPNPIFKPVSGGIEIWEKLRPE
jgi:hypothetical protein